MTYEQGQQATRVWQKWRLRAPQTHLWLIKIWFSASTFVENRHLRQAQNVGHNGLNKRRLTIKRI